MSVSAIGSTDTDYSLYLSSRQIEQQKESAEQQAEQDGTVKQAKQSSASVAPKISGLSNKTSDDEDSDQALINKAKAGSALTQSEMSRLKEVDPALYARLQAREELRNQSKYDQVELSAEATGLSRESYRVAAEG